MSKSMYNDALSKRLSYLKSFLVWANGHKYGVNDEFITFKPKLPKAHKAVRYLTPEELDKIYTMRLTPDTALERVRDMFVFQCYTSLRYSDLRQLKHENLTYNKREGRYYIEVVTEKNDKKITFPLSKRATEIYLKYKEYTYENELVFPIISNQKYNSQLKELGKFAQLEGEWTDTLYRLSNKVTIKIPKEDLTTHTARRTFIVTAFNEGIDLASIALVTSHSDFKSMKPYLTVSTEGADKVINAVDEADRKVSQKSKSK